MPELGKPLLLDPSDERWVAFTASQPRANIFHHPAWINLLVECYGYRPFIVTVCDANGRISAGLPMMEVNSLLTGRRWVSLPFTDYCAPLYCDDASLDQLTEILARLSRERGTPKIELRWELPAHPDIQSYTHYVLHTLKLDSDIELVEKQFHRTQRQNIRTARKGGIRIERGKKREHLDVFYRLQLQTRRRHGIPAQPWRFFDLLRTKILEQGLGFLSLAYKGDRCLAAGLFLHWQQTLTYKYAASSDSEESRSLRTNHLLSWTSIRWGCENGFARFDLGRSDIANVGLRTFKNRWGADEMPLTYSTVSAPTPRPMDNKLLRGMQAVIQNSPVWVCRVVGEMLYRHFG